MIFFHNFEPPAATLNAQTPPP